MSSDGTNLRDAFLNSDNRIRWQDLGGAIAGATAVEFFRLVTSIPLSLGRAIEAGLGGIGDAINSGGELLSRTLRSEAAAAFGTVDLGVVSFPVSALILALAIAIIAIGYSEVVFDE
jgi:hypothetical protein